MVVRLASDSDMNALLPVWGKPSFWGIPEVINLDSKFLVLVVVERGQDHLGATSGVILQLQEPACAHTYPYVWSFKRFVIVG